MSAPSLFNLLLLPLMAACLWEATARLPDALRHGRNAIIWLVMTLLILASQQLTAELPGGYSLGYLGAAFLALSLGYCRALLSMTVVVLITRPPELWGVALLQDALLPVWLMCTLVSVCHRYLPRNPFVFLLGCGFIGIFLVCVAQLLARAGLAWVFAGPAATAADGLPWSLLLAAGEATLEGMLVTVLVVYYPGAMHLFHDSDYWSAP